MSLNGNTIPYVPTAASAQQQIAAINRIIDIINSFQQQIVFADDSNKRMLIGYQKDGWGAGKDFGIKISKPGVDVNTASDSDLLFKMDISTWYWYDNNTGKNYMQIGVLPDGTGGMAVTKNTANVSEAF
jgi:hypothetical protein